MDIVSGKKYVFTYLRGINYHAPIDEVYRALIKRWCIILNLDEENIRILHFENGLDTCQDIKKETRLVESIKLRRGVKPKVIKQRGCNAYLDFSGKINGGNGGRNGIIKQKDKKVEFEFSRDYSNGVEFGTFLNDIIEDEKYLKSVKYKHLKRNSEKINDLAPDGRLFLMGIRTISPFDIEPYSLSEKGTLEYVRKYVLEDSNRFNGLDNYRIYYGNYG